MNTVELFSGTGSFSKIALKNGCTINTYDLADSADELVEGTHTQCDVLDQRIFYPKNPSIMWTSPPCTGFSVAAIGRNWHKETREPKTETARLGLEILERTIELIAKVRPDWWFIENPRGMMRKVIEPIFGKFGLHPNVRNTVTYCQYGDTRMKPTDIWTNAFWWKPKPPCKNGSPCHVSAPRGSRTGTQGIKGNRLRSVIPPEIFNEIFNQLERNTNDRFSKTH
tara:strand:- start:849 stop:1523 length:675 start_codon:yes stop_codon:yes gene_type:complete